LKRKEVILVGRQIDKLKDLAKKVLGK